jgi:hypothetical protein
LRHQYKQGRRFSLYSRRPRLYRPLICEMLMLGDARQRTCERLDPPGLPRPSEAASRRGLAPTALVQLRSDAIESQHAKHMPDRDAGLT